MSPHWTASSYSTYRLVYTDYNRDESDGYEADLVSGHMLCSSLAIIQGREGYGLDGVW